MDWDVDWPAVVQVNSDHERGDWPVLARWPNEGEWERIAGFPTSGAQNDEQGGLQPQASD